MTLESTLEVVLNRSGYNVFHYDRLNSLTLPRIVYQRIDKVTSRTLTARSLDTDRFQITVFTNTYTEGSLIADEVVRLLDLNTTDFMLSYFDGRTENHEVELKLYQVTLDFIISLRPA